MYGEISKIFSIPIFENITVAHFEYNLIEDFRVHIVLDNCDKESAFAICVEILDIIQQEAFTLELGDLSTQVITDDEISVIDISERI